MKWLRKKLSSSSSYSSPSPSSSTASTFPISWASKFKQKRETPTKDKKHTSRFVCSPTHHQYPHTPLGVERTKSTRKDVGSHEDHQKTYQRIMHNTSELRRGVDEPNQLRQCDTFASSSSQESKKSMSVRKSVYIGGGSQQRHSKQGKIRVCSPRTPSRREACKIKALEDLKRAQENNNKKKLKQEKPTEEVTAGMESFAVVKHSRDPQHDFRDSMMEMIMEKGIKKPEEMEELLACYLTLNADEYHDLIIKVFRQVWCELDDMRTLNQQLEELNMVFDN